MGMDFYGKAPSSKKGEYFRANIWWWHPLADYIELVAPEEASACQNWHNNSGDGLSADDALKLADRLQEEIDSGRCLRYAASRGTVGNVGTTSTEANHFIGAVLGVVNEVVADPAAKIEVSADTDFPFSVQTVQRFATFLRHCGGFLIC